MATVLSMTPPDDMPVRLALAEERLDRRDRDDARLQTTLDRISDSLETLVRVDEGVQQLKRGQDQAFTDLRSHDSRLRALEEDRQENRRVRNLVYAALVWLASLSIAWVYRHATG